MYIGCQVLYVQVCTLDVFPHILTLKAQLGTAYALKTLTKIHHSKIHKSFNLKIAFQEFFTHTY